MERVLLGKATLYEGKTVVVGMSGGVDSSVSAFLMKEAGAKVIGLFMRNWEEDDACNAKEDARDVALVCEKLDIPFYTVNFTQQYWDEVFSVCLQQFQKGVTPNPDILCNREIKFNLFLKKAFELGGDYLATGHYCQKKKIGGKWHLLRGCDPNKDQSYFLYTQKEKLLENILFPVGGLHKSEVRNLARSQNLITANKKDSTGICFVGKRDFKTFLCSYLPSKKGKMKTLDGAVVGEHDGAHLFTIGQRKGIGIGGEGPAWFVVDKQMQTNTVFVAQGEDHPALYREKLLAHTLSWVGEAPSFPLSCTAKIRYRTPDAACQVIKNEENKVEVIFQTPQKAVTPGQSIVFYQGPICLGGGIIIRN